MKNNIYKTIKKFHKDWGQTPGIGFLAGFHKTSKQNVLNHLRQLEKEKKLKIVSKKNYKIEIKI